MATTTLTRKPRTSAAKVSDTTVSDTVSDVTETVTDLNQKATETVNQNAEETAKAVEATVENAAEQVTSAMNQTYEQVEAQVEQFAEHVEDAQKAAGESSMAMVQSSKLAFAGFVELNNELLTFAHGNIHEAIETTKAMVNAKTMKEAMDLHTAYMRKTVQSCMDELKKISEMAKTTSEEAVKPLTANYQNQLKQAA